MDINEALRIMRESATKSQRQFDRTGFVSDDLAVEMFEAWQAIDEWLSKGGFLPTAWER